MSSSLIIEITVIESGSNSKLLLNVNLPRVLDRADLEILFRAFQLASKFPLQRRTHSQQVLVQLHFIEQRGRAHCTCNPAGGRKDEKAGDGGSAGRRHGVGARATYKGRDRRAAGRSG